jgi:AcrR family transcriptional regulator
MAEVRNSKVRNSKAGEIRPAPEPSAQTSLPAAPLSRASILATALQLVDAEGIAALSMRKLAQQLGVQAMSLYHHVANKDDILDGLIDSVISEIELPQLSPDLDWKAAMGQRALSAHAVLLRHPWATMALMSRINVGPAMLRYIDTTLGCLQAAGFSYEMADHAWNAMDSYIYGFTLQALNFPIQPEQYASVAASFLDYIPAEQYPHMNSLTHEVIAGRYNGLHQFEFGFNFILDGLERLRG